MHPRFELRRGILPTRKRFRFVLIAANGEPVAVSEHYTTKQAALDGIEAVKTAAAAAVIEDHT
jgi:uncharacterized protein